MSNFASPMGVLSIKHRFVFVHVPKTAGRSLAAALSEWGSLFCDCPVLAAAFKLADSSVPGHVEHVRARDIRSWLGDEQWAALYTFGFVRNPWDRMVSIYHFVQRTPTHPNHALIRAMDFETFVLTLPERPTPRPSWDWLSDEQGRRMVSEVFRFEAIDDAYRAIVARCALANAPALPRLNTGSRGDYRAYYTDAMAEIVAERFADDIARFGYRF